jgi:hypothetical protein
MVIHPKRLGFKLGLRIRIGEPASITEEPDAKADRDVVYVALVETSGLLKKGDVLKIGQTGGTLSARWRGIAGIFGPKNLRRNEKEDRRRWLKEADGTEVSVWVKKAAKMRIPYAKGLTRTRFSIRCAEEEFLDEYYRPRLGIQLNK